MTTSAHAKNAVIVPLTMLGLLTVAAMVSIYYVKRNSKLAPERRRKARRASVAAGILPSDTDLDAPYAEDVEDDELMAMLDATPRRYDPEHALAVCRAMADYIHRTGILVIRDPRVSTEDNDGFLDLLQRYYAQPREALMEELGRRGHEAVARATGVIGAT